MKDLGTNLDSRAPAARRWMVPDPPRGEVSRRQPLRLLRRRPGQLRRAVGSDYTLGTIHENGSAGSWMDYGIVKKPERSLHSQVGIYRPLFIRTWK